MRGGWVKGNLQKDKLSQHRGCFSHPWRSPGEYSFICNSPWIGSFSLKFKEIIYRKVNDSHIKHFLKQTLSQAES